MTDYTTAVLVKASLGITDTNDDTAIGNAITAASRAIDAYCGTTFAPVTEARYFDPDTEFEVSVDPFATTTGLVVQVGTDGTWPTTVASGDVVPYPHNAVRHGFAFTSLRFRNTILPVGYPHPSVKVTAAWGYASAPADVAEACLIKAAQLFRRKDSPEGVAGSGEFGVVRISRFEDPDVVKLLAPYVQHAL